MSSQASLVSKQEELGFKKKIEELESELKAKSEKVDSLKESIQDLQEVAGC